jgi:diguanylate cyclase (GGDEF) domain
MLIVNSFLLNIYLNLPIATASQVILMIAYVWHYSKQLSFFTIICSLAFIAVVFASYHWGFKLVKHPLTMYLGMDIMAVVSFALIVSIFPVSTDPYFWLRQIIALEILSILGIEYTLASNRLLEHTNQVAELAKLDGLTQLYNFSKFDEDLTNAYNNFQTNQESYAVFEFDIDHFKQINDSFGHLAGNTVLKAVAQELAHFAASTPYQSNAYRIGGEEFCLIVRKDCSSYQFATELANHIRQRISQLAFKLVIHSFTSPSLLVKRIAGPTNITSTIFINWPIVAYTCQSSEGATESR